MRKLTLLLAAAAVAIALGSCALETPAQGHVTVSVPRYLIAGSSAARVLEGGGNGGVTAIRLYIQLNGSFLKQAGGLDYFQTNLTAGSGSDANTITMDLPPTSGYKILASLGTTTNGWTTLYVGETQTFTVAAGVFTNQNLPIQYFDPAPTPTLLTQIPTASRSSTVTVGSNSGAVSYWL
ncbi:MAG TPA: hypothetical protein VFL04_01055, partial [Rectinemataceae bacterium]|nr:hypothetical protein [Rectinemataceae bacterium]